MGRVRAGGGVTRVATRPRSSRRAKQKAEAPLDLMQVALAKLDRRDYAKGAASQAAPAEVGSTHAHQSADEEGATADRQTQTKNDRMSEVLARLEVLA